MNAAKVAVSIAMNNSVASFINFVSSVGATE
jgi:hypothetical protein